MLKAFKEHLKSLKCRTIFQFECEYKYTKKKFKIFLFDTHNLNRKCQNIPKKKIRKEEKKLPIQRTRKEYGWQERAKAGIIC